MKASLWEPWCLKSSWLNSKISGSQQFFLSETTICFVERWKTKGKKRWQGLTPELITSNRACLLKLCLAMIKSLLSPLLLHFCDYVIGSGKGCPDPAIPQSRSFHGNPASRTYVIAILNIVFFPNPVSVPKFRRIPLCGWQSNPYPFNVSRIPHCLLVKFRDPGYTLHVRCQFNSFFFVFS